MTDESPDSFVDIVRNVFEFQRDTIPACQLLTPNSSKLLFLIWLRCFLINHMISSLFNIRKITVKKKEITVISYRVIICVLLSIYVLTNHKRMEANVKCWKKNIIFRRCNRWNILWNIETKHKSQELNYSGYIHLNAIHAQIIVESLGKIRYIKYGFSGHQNDQNHPLSKGVRFTCQ